jgi:hypothetical protein
MSALTRRQLFRIAGASAMAAVLPKALPAKTISVPARRTGVGRYVATWGEPGTWCEFRLVVTAVDAAIGTITVSAA